MNLRKLIKSKDTELVCTPNKMLGNLIKIYLRLKEIVLYIKKENIENFIHDNLIQ